MTPLFLEMASALTLPQLINNEIFVFFSTWYIIGLIFQESFHFYFDVTRTNGLRCIFVKTPSQIIAVVALNLYRISDTIFFHVAVILPLDTLPPELSARGMMAADKPLLFSGPMDWHAFTPLAFHWLMPLLRFHLAGWWPFRRADMKSFHGREGTLHTGALPPMPRLPFHARGLWRRGYLFHDHLLVGYIYADIYIIILSVQSRIEAFHYR